MGTTAKKVKKSEARKSCALPRKMTPSKEVFKKLGFVFNDIGDEILLDAKLPEGWTTELIPSSTVLYEKLIDEKGRERGEYYYKGDPCDRSGWMRLHSRYNVVYLYFDPTYWCSNTIKIFVSDSANSSVVFTAGRCIDEYSEKFDKLVKKAEMYLESTYPDWKDVTKYWD